MELPLPGEGMGSRARIPPLRSWEDEEKMKKSLFNSTMKGDWEKVVNLYTEHPDVQKIKITRSGDTALHIAVSNGAEDIVEQLVKLMSSNEALKVENERGNTPLHFAASLGNVRLCEYIASKDSALIGARNHDSETPIFLAALHGRKDAFLRLHSKIRSTDDAYLYCRRNDGETVLHVAIIGDYFDLAFQIIHKYEKLVNYVNEQGLTPLHLIASKPTAFRSGSHLVRLNWIIYHCIFVDELTVDTTHDQPDDTSKPSEDGKNQTHPEKYDTCINCNNPTYPENYDTCINFFRLVSKIYRVLVSGRKGWHCFFFQKKKEENDKEADARVQDNLNQQGLQSSNQTHEHQLFPINYDTCFDSIKFISKAMLIILGFGFREIRKIEEKKEKHTWSVQIMNELLRCASTYEYDDNGQKPQYKEGDAMMFSFGGGNIDTTRPPDQPTTPQVANDKSSSEAKESQEGKSDEKNRDAAGEKENVKKKETPILVAAKNGITEMVEKVLELFPVAIHDINTDKKNMVLLAVENRQPHIYQLLLEMKIMKDSVFRKVDIEGNSALHLAAKLGDHRPWRIPGAALQMQWEIKWYEFVKESMPMHFFVRHNLVSETAREVFTKSHSKLLKEGGKWLTSTSKSCSIVAALIATVAFATSSTVPGGVMKGKGTPTLERETPFSIFAISSLIALCFSVTSMIMFLAILTSRYEERDFGVGLPRKLLVGLTSLFISITAILISFCAGHFFVLKDKLKFAAFPVYLVTCLPVTFFAAAQFPLYFDLIWATARKVPQRSYKAVPL